jgi:hypothetical protein
MAIQLFDRKLVVQVHDMRITDLTMTFDILKSLAPKTPNTAEVRIWNLNPAHRKQLQELEKVYLSVEAGYEEGTSLIFRGDLRDVSSAREGAHWITTITSDSGRRARKKRIVKSFAPGASVTDVITAAAKAMGVDIGNAAVKTVLAKIQGTQANKFFNGYALAGTLGDEVDRLARSTGLEWSVQDNELQFLDRGAPLQEEGVKLTAATGLIGSPEPGNKGVIEVRCLLIPDIFPGRRIQIESEHVKGVYRIETAKYHGGTAEKDWYIDLQLKAGAKGAKA